MKVIKSSYFQYIFIDGVPEIQEGFFVELLPINDAHLLEKGGLSTFSSTEEENLHQPAHGPPLPGKHRVYLPALAPRLPAALLAVARVPAGLGREQTAAQGADHSRHVVGKVQNNSAGEMFITGRDPWDESGPRSGYIQPMSGTSTAVKVYMQWVTVKPSPYWPDR